MGLVRRLAERISRDRMFRRSLTVGDQRLQLYVSADARLNFLKPGRSAFDPDLVRVARSFVGTGDCVWDIGANVGVFAFVASLKARTVIAFEPDNWLVELLNKTR